MVKLTVDNSLAVLRPDLAAEWDYERNGDLRPEDVTPGSGKKAWWVCKAKHSWEATINNRSRGRGCPYVHLDQSLAVLRPDLAAEWDYERNGDLRPEDVTPGSGKQAWWVCKTAKHSWEARISNRSRGNGCPYVHLDRSLAVLRPDLAAEWDCERNGDLRPEDVTPGSRKKAWWGCKANHSWEATINSRSQGNVCPYVHLDRSLTVLRPDLAAEWDYERNGDLRPEDVTLWSNKKAWWVCKAKHSWEATISNRSQGRGCPVCSGRRVGADNNLAVLRPDLAVEWDYERNGDLRPEDVTPGSGKQAWWVCKTAKHSWEARISNRSRGNGCPYVHLDQSPVVTE